MLSDVCGKSEKHMSYLFIVWLLTFNDQSIPNRLSLIFEELEINWDEQTKTFIDPIGEAINVQYEEVDLNRDGRPELLINLYGSYYLWGVTGGTCIVVDQNGEVLLEVIAVECEVGEHITNNYQDLLITGRKGKYSWRWNGTAYGFVE
jgi:hypothetical protein